MELRSHYEPSIKLYPRIYVTSLADHHAGRHHGVWMDADQPAYVLKEGIARMLAASTEPLAEDWAICGYEGFGAITLNEKENLHLVAHYAFLLRTHGPVVGCLAQALGGLRYLDSVEHLLMVRYAGAFESAADYAQQVCEEKYGAILSQLPEAIAFHIDYDSVARDLECRGDIFTIDVDCHTHVFYGCI